MAQSDYRDARQTDAHRWAAKTFGTANMTERERARRFIEEAIELAQACGLQRADVYRTMEHVFDRPPGERFQEVGGVGVTLLMLCETIGVSADYAERSELARVLSMPANHFRDRHNVKADAGIAERAA